MRARRGLSKIRSTSSAVILMYNPANVKLNITQASFLL